MEVYNTLGRGFLEVVYKDALVYEFSQNKIPFVREKEYEIRYKDIILPRKYNADFVIYDSIILEVKCTPALTNEFVKQTLNYLSVSKNKLGIIVNFGESSLTHKRVVL